MPPTTIHLQIADADLQIFLSQISTVYQFPNVQSYLLQLISEDRLRRIQAEKNATAWKDVFDQLKKVMDVGEGLTQDTVILKNL